MGIRNLMPRMSKNCGGSHDQLIREFLKILCASVIGIGIGFIYILNTTNVANTTTQREIATEQIEDTSVSEINSAVKSAMPSKISINKSEVAAMAVITTTTAGPYKPPLFITPSQIGRLGNLLFQYATAYGVARTVGKRLHLKASSEILSYFPDIAKKAYITESDAQILDRRGVGDPKHCGFAPSVIQESKAAFNIGMGGYFQSWRYFDAYRAELQTHLLFNEAVQQETDKQLDAVRTRALAALNAATPNQKVTELMWVAVHIRRGDIVTPHFASYGYLPATAEYLRKSANYFVEKYRSAKRGVVFTVFSDDKAWSSSNFIANSSESPNNGTRVYVEHIANKKPEVDMNIMIRCNATIMSVGSYGWWAAYLSGGETFYYAYPFRAGSDLSRQFIMEDYYPSHWHMFF